MSTFKELDERFGITQALIVAGQIAAAQGDMAAARASYKECWEQAQAIGALEFSASCLEGAGEVLAAQGEATSAATLWGRAALIRANLIAPMPPIERIRYAQSVATAREQLGSEEFKAAWLEGSWQEVLSEL